MPASFYQIRQCVDPACGLRYPLVEAHPFGERCPLCLGETRISSQRPLTQEVVSSPAPLPRIHLEALLDNVRSAWNVGAIFRTADGLGVEKLHLCGITPTPGNASVAKTALGAEKNIPWTASKNALTAALALQSAGARLWALEQDERAIPLGEQSLETLLSEKIVLIVGNEVTGVDPALLDLCERIVFIPMRGQKRSLNVEVAFGVAVSWLVR